MMNQPTITKQQLLDQCPSTQEIISVAFGQCEETARMLLSLVAQAEHAHGAMPLQHPENVMRLSAGMLNALHADEQLPVHLDTKRTRYRAAFATALHDIGKLIVPSDVVNKKGGLNEAERRLLQNHTVGVEGIINGMQIETSLRTYVMDAATGHHERYDGNGYPKMLHSQEIPLIAQITAIADVYDVMTSRLVYKHAMEHGEAIAKIAEESGAAFSPMCVNALQSLSRYANERAAHV